MAERTCHNCVYSRCDSRAWLRAAWKGEPLVPQCANHLRWPGQLHDVSDLPCRNYRPRPADPTGDDIRWIPLGDGFYAYVDAADYEWLTQWNWHMCNAGYPARNEKGRTILMHRQIMQPGRGLVVDHIDGSKANNCRFNLRVCTREENMRNQQKRITSSSRFKGVCYSKHHRKWCAYIKFKRSGRPSDGLKSTSNPLERGHHQSPAQQSVHGEGRAGRKKAKKQKAENPAQGGETQGSETYDEEG